MPQYKFLTEQEVEKLKEYLVAYTSLPFGGDIPGEIVEVSLARARGAEYVAKRANRPTPDMILKAGGRRINYQIKTEKCPDNRVNAKSKRGTAAEDIITARIVVGDVLAQAPTDSSGRKVPDAAFINGVGRKVLETYVSEYVVKYDWHRLAILLRYKQNNEFLYFEEDAYRYDPNRYDWKLTSAGERNDKLNIMGYEKGVLDAEGNPKKKFKWNIGTTLLYVFHDIPADADYFEIRKKSVDIEKLRVFMDGQGYPTDEEIRSAITAALEVNEEIDQQFLPTITVKDAVVTVKGEIDTANARKALLKTVWATPGVRDVVDQMKILSKRQLAARQNQQPLLTPPPAS